METELTQKVARQLGQMNATASESMALLKSSVQAMI
jgi:hypothetical protein